MDDMMAALTSRLQQSTDDPLMSMLLQQMVSRQEAAPPSEDRADQLKVRLQRAGSIIERLRAEAVAANDMAAFVARVLGACPKCWGLDRFCRECRGAGAPGSGTPDIDQLLDWIGPALRKAGLVAVPVAGNSGEQPYPPAVADMTYQPSTTKGASDVSA